MRYLGNRWSYSTTDLRDKYVVLGFRDKYVVYKFTLGSFGAFRIFGDLVHVVSRNG